MYVVTKKDHLGIIQKSEKYLNRLSKFNHFNSEVNDFLNVYSALTELEYSFVLKIEKKKLLESLKMFNFNFKIFKNIEVYSNSDFFQSEVGKKPSEKAFFFKLNNALEGNYLVFNYHKISKNETVTDFVLAFLIKIFSNLDILEIDPERYEV